MGYNLLNGSNELNNDASKFSWDNAAAPAAAADEHEGGTLLNVDDNVFVISFPTGLLFIDTSDDDDEGSSKAAISDGW